MEKKNPNPTSSLPEFYNNKENWGEGPWLNEPGMNEPVFFDYKDYRCMLLRNDFGSWCGYVEVSAESKKVYRTLEYARNKLKGLVDQMKEDNE